MCLLTFFMIQRAIFHRQIKQSQLEKSSDSHCHAISIQPRAIIQTDNSLSNNPIS
jgi:hypothetical protein